MAKVVEFDKKARAIDYLAKQTGIERGHAKSILMALTGMCYIDDANKASGLSINNCPFCHGNNVELVEPWSETSIAVECFDCGIRGPVVKGRSDNKAIEHWNKITLE